MSDDKQGVMVATHYREGSIVAIARAAARNGLLARFYTTLYSPQFLSALKYFPLKGLRRRLERGLSRRAFPGIPAEAVEVVSLLPELMRVLAYRLPRGQALADRLNYEVKEAFDHAVAQRLAGRSAGAFVGMYAAAERTLRAARDAGMLTVLNFVNSHPLYHNCYLKTLAELPDGHHELLPPRVMERVDRELELADVVLIPSRFIAQQLESVGVPKAKVAIEPYGVDLAVFRPASPKERSARRNSPLRCLYVGAISHRKGIRVLVEAARRLRNRPVEFVLIGILQSPEVLRDAPENVHWRGMTLHGGVAEEMRRADLFVLPSLEDSYGLVTVEAMASGLPVIVSDHAGTSELITPGADGLIVPAGDVQALAHAIDNLLEDGYLRRALGAAARRKVEAGHSWEEYGDRILARLHQHLATETVVTQMLPARGGGSGTGESSDATGRA